MRNEQNWEPSRFELRQGQLRTTRNTAALSLSSRLSASLAIRCYSDWVPRTVKGHLLDLGCGRVPMYSLYRQYADKITCVDWAPPGDSVNHIDIVCDLSKEIPVASASVDVILISSVLEHIPEPTVIYAEMERVLAPGGVVLLNIPFLYWIHEAPHDYYRFTQFAIERLATNAGFRVSHLESLGGLPILVADACAKTFVRFSVPGRLAARFVQWAASLFAFTSLGRRMCRRSRKRMPSGYFVVLEKPMATTPFASSL